MGGKGRRVERNDYPPPCLVVFKIKQGKWESRGEHTL